MSIKLFKLYDKNDDMSKDRIIIPIHLPSSATIAQVIFICGMSLVAGVILAEPILIALEWWLSW